MPKKQPYIGHARTRLHFVTRAEHAKVDATRCRNHLLHLQSLGMTKMMIARVAGTSAGVVANVVNGSERVAREIESALLSASPRPHPQQAIVLAYGLTRRLDGLAVQGWPLSRIGAEAGLSPQILDKIRRQTRTGLTQHQLVAQAYERMSHVRYGDVRTLKFAAREGFLHPMMWDDIDDFYETPVVPADSGAVDEIVVSRLVGGRRVMSASAAEQAEAVRVLTDRGASAAEIAVALGVSGRTVARYRAVAS